MVSKQVFILLSTPPLEEAINPRLMLAGSSHIILHESQRKETVTNRPHYITMFRLTLFSACLLSLCAGFAPQLKTRPPAPVAASSPRFLASRVAGDYLDDDLHFRHVITQARECAFAADDNAAYSPMDARQFLHEILHLESGCSSGTLSGDICNIDEDMVNIVSHLRAKAEQRASDVIIVTAPDVALTLMSTTTLLMVTAVLLSVMGTPGSESSPYTFQEWMWATQGGYLDNMVAHYFRNGGL